MDLDLAGDLLDARRPDLAERELRRRLAGEPAHAGALALLALALSAQDRHAEALAAAEEALRLEPDHRGARQALAEVHVRRGDGPAAEAAARAALALDPESPRLHGLLAAALLSRWRHQEALQAAEAGLRLDPGDVMCLLQKAQALHGLGRLDEARAASAEALRLSPEGPAPHAVHGAVEVARGNHDEGRARLREALRLDPGDVYAETHLGVHDLPARDTAAVLLLLRARAWRVAVGAVLALLAAGTGASLHRARWGGIPWMALVSLAHVALPVLLLLAHLRSRRHVMDVLTAPGALRPADRFWARAALVLWLLMGVGLAYASLA